MAHRKRDRALDAFHADLARLWEANVAFLGSIVTVLRQRTKFAPGSPERLQLIELIEAELADCKLTADTLGQLRAGGRGESAASVSLAKRWQTREIEAAETTARESKSCREEGSS